MLRYFTAGESHGPCLTMIIDRLPAGFAIEVGKNCHPGFYDDNLRLSDSNP